VDRGGGPRRRRGEWRAWTPGGVLPGLNGDDAAPGHGLRAAVRIRYLPPVHPGRLATRRGGPLVASPGPVGGGAAARVGGSAAQLLVRGAWWQLARHPRPAVHPVWDPV